MKDENDDSGLTPITNHINEQDAHDREHTELKPPEQDEDTMITQYAEPITHENAAPSTHSNNNTADYSQKPDGVQASTAPTTSAPKTSIPMTPRVPELSQQLEKDLVQVFKLLADETRLKILFYLGREKELHVSALCQRLGQSQPAVSHHLALLRVAGLIEPRRDGKHNYYSVQQSTFHEIVGELFKSFTEDSNSSEVRFDDFVFKQNSK